MVSAMPPSARAGTMVGAIRVVRVAFSPVHVPGTRFGSAAHPHTTLCGADARADTD